VNTFDVVIYSVIFYNDENGYAILKVGDPNNFDDFIAVGTMPDPIVDGPVRLIGDWIEHKKYGRQFKFSSYTLPEPTSREAAIAYLQSVKGLGGSKGIALYDHFGEDVFDILDNEPDRLIEVKGIGPKSLKRILEDHGKKKGMRLLIQFLHSIGVSAGYAKNIYNQYGDNSIYEIKSNPYILSSSVRGFGFKRSDELARGLGIENDSFIRLSAGIHEELRQASQRGGHCFLMMDELCSKVCDLIRLPGYSPKPEDIQKVIKDLNKASVRHSQQLHVEDDAVYRWPMYLAEAETADFIRQMVGEFRDPPVDINLWIDRFEDPNRPLAKAQRQAIRTAASCNFMILTGGPGSGKTHTSNAIIQYFHSRGLRIKACALAAKAAMRIKEVTGIDATTIHRLLGWNGSNFVHNRDNPLELDVLLLDESSMVDIKLFHSLMESVPRYANVVLIGDVDQLPSVGAGNVLRDLINSKAVPVIRLTEVFRQSADSKIIDGALSINAGKIPELESIGRSTTVPYSDSLFIKCPKETIPVAIQWLLDVKLPELNWKKDDIQVLSPMHKGEYGTQELNKRIQDLWNPNGKELKGFRSGDRIIQRSNNYDKSIFNGEIGTIEYIDTTENEMTCKFPDISNPEEGRLVVIDDNERGDMQLAYAISIHSSQGSEFPVVVIPVTTSHHIMLIRNLLYTGWTRAKKLIVLVGEEEAIKRAVKNNYVNKRNTRLKERLC
jgi:exodeoxyribonuclease V alpha subunit